MPNMADNEHYRRFVATLPCCVTGKIGSTAPHHVVGYAWLTNKAWALKGTDLTCIPLDDELHQELHKHGHATFELKYNVSQLEIMITTLLFAEKMGVLVIDNAMAKSLNR